MEFVICFVILIRLFVNRFFPCFFFSLSLSVHMMLTIIYNKYYNRSISDCDHNSATILTVVGATAFTYIYTLVLKYTINLDLVSMLPSSSIVVIHSSCRVGAYHSSLWDAYDCRHHTMVFCRLAKWSGIDHCTLAIIIIIIIIIIRSSIKFIKPSSQLPAAIIIMLWSGKNITHQVVSSSSSFSNLTLHRHILSLSHSFYVSLSLFFSLSISLWQLSFSDCCF